MTDITMKTQNAPRRSFKECTPRLPANDPIFAPEPAAGPSPAPRRTRHALPALTLAVLTVLFTGEPAAAAPVFDKVLSGKVTLPADLKPGTAFTDSSLEIEGHKRNNVLQWQSFDIDHRQTVNFKNGNFLNLITDSKPSRISGVIKGNGSVYLVNPHGITLEKGSAVQVHNFGASSARLDAADLQAFIDGPQFDDTDYPPALFPFSDKQGMGKIRLLGSVYTNNLYADGGQIIIRDANIINAKENQGGAPLVTDADKGFAVQLQSSTDRIDVGFGGFADGAKRDDTSKTIDPAKEYTLINTPDSAVITHENQTAIASASDLRAINTAMDGAYWLADDLSVDLTAPVGTGKAFTGTLDGAYQHISYELSVPADKQYAEQGLFAALDGAEIKNLRLDHSSVDLSTAAENPNLTALKAGALAGSITDSTITNVEADSFSLKGVDAVKDSGRSLQAGALTGAARDVKLENVTAGFSAESAADLAGAAAADAEHIQAGSVFGSAEGALELKGLTAGLNDDLPSIGRNAAVGGAAPARTFAEAAAAGDPAALGYITAQDGSAGRLAHFLSPYFVQNFTFEYDGSAHNYLDLLTDAFTGQVIDPKTGTADDVTAIVNAPQFLPFDADAYGDEQGNVVNAGEYKYQLQTSGDRDGFYLVQPEGQDGSAGKRTLDGVGTLTITKRPLGEIVIGDVTITAGDSAQDQSAVVNADQLNFAAGENLSQFNGHTVLPEEYSEPGEYEIGFTAEGLDTNYTYTVKKGTLTVKAPPEPEPQPEPEPVPDPELPAAPVEEQTAVLAIQNVTPCDYCKGRDSTEAAPQLDARGILWFVPRLQVDAEAPIIIANNSYVKHVENLIAMAQQTRERSQVTAQVDPEKDNSLAAG